MRRVALLVETSRTYTRDILAGVRRYLESHGPWSTFLELRAFDSPTPSWLENWDGDGILTRTHSRRMADSIAAAGVPSVELRSTNFNRSMPSVGMDNALIGQMVAQHFINRGYRRFAAYTLDTESFFRERVRNFVSCVETEGSTCSSLPAHGEGSPDNWERHQSELIDWLRSLEKPVGIFATNDQLAVRLIDACRRADIGVPEEVAVVGCENETALCEFSSPTLTSVEFDGEAVGFEAASILDRLMDGASVPMGSVLIPPRGIVVRGSSDEFVIDDPVALRAVKLIRENAFSGITVGEISRQLRISRSTLERRMKDTLKRGAKEELLRVRFREVARLLRNTDLTIETIAEATGFSHAHYLQTSFKARFGATPGEFRKSGKKPLR